ncbi:hypothetical protein LG275_13085 [Chryseomicrobium palamuruense]
MSERIIYTADLSRIENYLSSVSNEVDRVSDKVNFVNQEVQDTKITLEQLVDEFHEYMRRDQLDKNIQLSETRLVKVRQELETKFGHYGTIRRKVTGILQAVDVSLVKKETIEHTSEEQLLNAPKYWLAPCLIALSAWLNNNKELADKAMNEALRRDDEKTSLFFALVTRRGGRYKASRQWLDRFFDLQDPHQLEREIVILIDGFTNGIFGPDARVKTGEKINSWIEQLSEKPGFVEEQQQQWSDALASKEPQLDQDLYPYLSQYSPTWPELKKNFEGALLHEIIADYFQDIFSKEITPSKSIALAVDALLDTLVTKFDSEELPLRREERLLNLTIEENGDRNRAEKLFEKERTTEERTSFTQLLTNFAMHPDISGATNATQKFSIALSKDWIRSAHDDLTASNHMQTPLDVQIDIDVWSGTSRDGSNEKELLNSLDSDFATRKENALSRLKIEPKHWLSLGLTGVFLIMGFSNAYLFILAIIAGVYFYNGKTELDRSRNKIISDYNDLYAQSAQVLRAVLAELVDFRRAYQIEDAKSEQVRQFLDSISAEHYSFTSLDKSRSIKTS